MKKTLRELLAQGINIVYIKSYGYNELSQFGSVWQPFSNVANYIPLGILRKIKLYFLMKSNQH